ncbi:putative phage holin [Streptosporangium minutum]|uniref:Uncharacterized protein n=1 Tax=Streptosporangium minutum TaxID=569862 RepID=A0A243RVR7_9ACTN|nr:hypothetical protein [Streptosporangium minutum]OUC99307.1 hypothetical protein CA984_03615 [Streptosporangium minutum]
MIQFVGGLLVIASAVFAATAALLYGTRFPWWRSADGRHLFAYQVVIGAALTLWAGRLIATDQLTGPAEPGPWPYIRLVWFGLIAWVLGWRLLIITRAWREQRRDRVKEER